MTLRRSRASALQETYPGGLASDRGEAPATTFRPCSVAAAGLLLLATVTGCENGHTAPPTVSVTNYIVRTGPGMYDLHDFEAEEISEGGFELSDSTKIITGQYVCGHVQFGGRDFHVLFGPDWGVAGEEGGFVYDGDSFSLLSGWALLKGHAPIGRTQRTQASSDGTTLLLQVYRNGTTIKDRVYLIASGTSNRNEVKSLGAGIPVNLGFDTFACVENESADGTPTAPVVVPANPADERWQFLMRVKEVADVVGWWPP